jgi:hypothetical protein
MDSFHFGLAQTGTTVNGLIASNTEWTKANSPYTLTGNILVNNSVTLTIEPGVIVNLGNYYITISGTLTAIGSSNDKIVLNEGTIEFTPKSSGWNEQTNSGCVIEKAVLSTGLLINGSPEIHDVTSNLYGITIVGGSPTIQNNTITRGGIIMDPNVGTFGTVTISDNTISNISNNMPGISISNGISGTIIIERNLITDSSGGIGLGSKATIQNNTIANNTIGIGLSSKATIVYNNILNNSRNIDLYSSDNINATYNWWGTTDIVQIGNSIHDSKNDFNLGTVTFLPDLTAPNPQAMPTLNASTPTPSPTPTPTVTQTQTPTPSQTSSASIPEFPTWIILTLATLATLIIVTLTETKKQRNKTEPNLGRLRA